MRRHSAGELAGDDGIEILHLSSQPLYRAGETAQFSYIALQQHAAGFLGPSAQAEFRREQEVQHRPFLRLARPPAHLEGGPGGEGHQVHRLAVCRGSGYGREAAGVLRQQCQSAGERQMILAGNVQPLEILVGDVGVGADVDNVDAVHGVVILQLLDRPGDDAPRYQALAEAGLVGDQEAPARLRASIETIR